ncbi:MAG: enamine deaminase RidA (YjgF/YER057c/UK114 family) [Candidatus Marivariicella framensis]|jgi:enamine deaminase RidA (YjgF/YER057c/UK114 family)|tara:strand:- start:2159 stop:2626 length:468 start_codon:yes stop_codon:yes gene_type:complete
MITLPSQRIEKLQLILPSPPKPAGLYKPIIVSGNLLFVSGQGPLKEDGTLMKGKVGKDLSSSEAKIVARQVGLTMLATIKEHFKDIDRIKKIVKVLGMVNCTLEFEEHPFVINGFSELMRDVFGEDLGVGARSAVGNILPGNIPVEIEAIFELHS